VQGKPSLCLIAAACFLALAGSASAARKASTTAGILQAVNAVRVSHGLAPLRVDPALGRAAESHTLDMLRGNYFAHGDFQGRMLAFHLTGLLGENLAWGSGPYARARAIVQMWLESAEHRANLLRASFHRIGLGVARGTFQGAAGATIVTADFGS
jgi:uncharacterized protein YkwD